MAIENFIIQLYKESVNAMAGTEWMWPETWDLDRKINFLQEALSYGEKNELYEQCSIIRDVKNKIQTQK
jgi:protein-arginine kinase activator protein McsA